MFSVRATVRHIIHSVPGVAVLRKPLKQTKCFVRIQTHKKERWCRGENQNVVVVVRRRVHSRRVDDIRVALWLSAATDKSPINNILVFIYRSYSS